MSLECKQTYKCCALIAKLAKSDSDRCAETVVDEDGDVIAQCVLKYGHDGSCEF